MQPDNNQDKIDLASQLFPKRANQVTKPIFGSVNPVPEAREVVVNEPTIVPSSQVQNVVPTKKSDMTNTWLVVGSIVVIVIIVVLALIF
jgi:hypothetical protein